MRRPRPGTVAGLILAAGLLLAACGDSSGPGGDSLGAVEADDVGAVEVDEVEQALAALSPGGVAAGGLEPAGGGRCGRQDSGGRLCRGERRRGERRRRSTGRDDTFALPACGAALKIVAGETRATLGDGSDVRTVWSGCGAAPERSWVPAG